MIVSSRSPVTVPRLSPPLDRTRDVPRRQRPQHLERSDCPAACEVSEHCHRAAESGL